MKRCFVRVVAGVLACLMVLGMVVAANAADVEEKDSSVVAAELFSDVADNGFSDERYDALVCLAERGIVLGNGVGKFNPNDSLTVRQWAVIICRAVGFNGEGGGEKFGNGSIRYAVDGGWLPESAASSPDAAIMRGDMAPGLLFALRTLHPDCDIELDGLTLDERIDELWTALVLDLFEEYPVLWGLDFDHIKDLYYYEKREISRIEAAVCVYRLFQFDAQKETLFTSDALSVSMYYDGVGDLTAYMDKLDSIPAPIIEKFCEFGWELMADHAYIRENAWKTNTNYLPSEIAGLSSYDDEVICVVDPDSLIHEFGHFLHDALGFPYESFRIFEAEAKAAAQVLGGADGRYAQRNAYEYFAECFKFWINNRGDAEVMARLEASAPETYRYFMGLEANGWV